LKIDKPKEPVADARFQLADHDDIDEPKKEAEIPKVKNALMGFAFKKGSQNTVVHS
jgi:hypothetical protein